MKTGRVLVNDRCLYRHGAGIQIYLNQCLASWPDNGNTNLIGACTHRLLRRKAWPLRSPQTSNGPIRIRPMKDLKPPADSGLKARARQWSGRVYENIFEKLANPKNIDLYFEPNNLAMATELPTVTTLHDLSVIEHPNWHPPQRIRWYERCLEPSLAATRQWIAPSRFTSNRMQDLLGIEPENIQVIPEASRFSIRENPTRLNTSMSGLPDRYCLFLGTIEPRKNLRTVINAHDALPTELKRDCPLLVAGTVGWGNDHYFKDMADNSDPHHVFWIDSASDAQIEQLMRSAELTLVPSQYEGFGLPLIEAMACGSAVICSNAPAFEEMVQEHMPTVETKNIDAWRQAMVELLTDDAAREHRVKAGLELASQYSWSQTAMAHERCFEQVTASA